MKATVELPDFLFEEMKACAELQGVPFRQLVEEGLRLVLQQSQTASKPFRLRDGSFPRNGLQGQGSWPEIRSFIYEGRGE